MGSSCVIVPTVKVGNKEVDSRLFKDLLSFTKDREVTKTLWGLSQIDAIKNQDGIELDSNGEVTLDSFKAVFGLSNFLKGESKTQEVKKEIGATDKSGNPINYKEVTPLIEKIIEFNKTSDDLVANVSVTPNNEYNIEVNKKNIKTTADSYDVTFKSALNNNLLAILNKVGFTVKVNESLKHNGLFNPLNADSTGDTLSAVVEIAEGKRGEDVFPEEFSHVIIEGLIKNPLVERLLSITKNEDFIKDYLGDSYQEYYDEYNGDINRLSKEVAGQILAKTIVGQENKSKQPLVTRLWSVAKNLLSKITKNDINLAYENANRIAKELNTIIKSDSFVDLFDPKEIFNARPLYSINKEVNKQQQLAEKALQLYSKRMDILRRKSKTGEYREEDVETVKKLNKLIEAKKYSSSLFEFLKSTLSQIELMHDSLIKNSNIDTKSEGIAISIASRNLLMIKEFKDAYEDIIKELMTLESYVESSNGTITKEDAEAISQQATSIFKVMNDIDINYNKSRFNTVFSFLKEFWGEDKTITLGKDRGKILTLESMLSGAEKDINFIDRFISSVANASDPLTNLLYKIIAKTNNKRDAILSDILDEIRVIDSNLTKAGYSSDFMYEKDTDGVPTMKIISNVDHAKYIKEREEYKVQLEKSYDGNFFKVKSKLQQWENNHTTSIIIDKESGRKSIIPNPKLYPSDAYSKLDSVQKEYYDKMMQLKGVLDSMIPYGESRIYDTVNITNDLVEGIHNNISDPKKATKIVLDTIKDNFIRRKDDRDIAEGFEDKTKVTLDFTGKPVNTLPVYYVAKLEDATRLSTDFTGSLMAYAGMAINYHEMNKIINGLELTRSLMADREVSQYSGSNKVVEAFTVMNNKFESEFKDKGSNSNIMKLVDDFFESVIYNKKKKDEGTFNIPIVDIEIDRAKTGDALKNYTSILGLGLNAFSGISNILAGDTQLLIESGASKYFGIKNLLKAKKQYFSSLPAYIGELNSKTKTNKLYLLGKKFDVSEDFFGSLREERFSKGVISRILGKFNVYFLNSIGEHYLHNQTMLAMLDNTKIKVDGRETSLYDAFEVKDIYENGTLIATKLVVKDNATQLDGSKITDEYIEDIKNKINIINKSMNGGFSEEDKGAINRYTLGRLVMQHRQWMPEHYNRRLARAYYDNMIEEYREGYYRTFGRFIKGLAIDISRAKFEFATRYNELNNTERENLRRTFTELSIFTSLLVFIGLMGPAKDKKGSWFDRMVLYQAKRLQLEVGASIPFLPEFAENNWQLLQSPAASIKTLNNITDVLQFWNAFEEIQGGRYSGMNRWQKDVLDLIPLHDKVRKLHDITEEDYMFNIFKSRS